jgi:hypothetical protein
VVPMLGGTRLSGLMRSFQRTPRYRRAPWPSAYLRGWCERCVPMKSKLSNAAPRATRFAPKRTAARNTTDRRGRFGKGSIVRWNARTDDRWLFQVDVQVPARPIVAGPSQPRDNQFATECPHVIARIFPRGGTPRLHVIGLVESNQYLGPDDTLPKPRYVKTATARTPRIDSTGALRGANVALPQQSERLER